MMRLSDAVSCKETRSRGEGGLYVSHFIGSLLSILPRNDGKLLGRCNTVPFIA
jgi:hypothetical protein